MERAPAVLGAGWVSDALRDSYKRGRELMARPLRGCLVRGSWPGTRMVLVDPLDDELHADGQPMYQRRLQRAEELEAERCWSAARLCVRRDTTSRCV